ARARGSRRLSRGERSRGAGGSPPPAASPPSLRPTLGPQPISSNPYLGGVGWNEFSAEVTVKATPQRVFDYFADYRHVAQVLGGVSKWEPIGRKTRGVGARYNVEMVAFGFPLKSVLVLDRWSPPE